MFETILHLNLALPFTIVKLINSIFYDTRLYHGSYMLYLSEQYSCNSTLSHQSIMSHQKRLIAFLTTFDLRLLNVALLSTIAKLDNIRSERSRLVHS